MEENGHIRGYLLCIFNSHLIDAHCSICCERNQPVVALKYAGRLPADDSEEVYAFNARPICSSTRAHQGCKLVLVIVGVPNLPKPMMSVPIELHARQSLKRSKVIVPGHAEDSMPQPTELPTPISFAEPKKISARQLTAVTREEKIVGIAPSVVVSNATTSIVCSPSFFMSPVLVYRKLLVIFI